MKNNNLTLLFSLAKANSVITRRLAVHGLDFSDFIILYYLNEAEGKKLRRIDLAQKLGLTASGITRMLLPLEKIHIITRDQSDEDARARYATLTKAGEQLFSEAAAMLDVKLEDAIPTGAEKLLPEFSAFLDKLTENLLQPEYQQEARMRWGNSEAYQQSTERMKKMSKTDVEQIKIKGEDLTRRLAAAMKLGAADPATQKLISEHYESLRQFYEPNLKMYRGLGQMYADDPRFAAYYEKFAPGLAKFMREAINIFCDK